MIKPTIPGLVWYLTIIITIILFNPNPVWGLDSTKDINQYLSDQWTTADGIPSNNIFSISQTPDGYLWIATSKGLVRFDGVSFSLVNIPYPYKGKRHINQNIIPDTLFLDSNGILWIGSTAGLTSYDYQVRRFKTYTEKNGLTSNGDRFRLINEDMRGNLWLSFFSRGVNYLKDKTFSSINLNDGQAGKFVNAIIEDQKGNLLFAFRENGIFSYQYGSFTKVLIPGLENHSIIAMHEDREGTIWIGTTKGLFRFKDNQVDHYSTKDGLSENYITNVLEDSEHNLWIATKKGLNRLKKQPENAVNFESLLQNVIVKQIFEDREKNIWLGTDDAGLIRLKNGTVDSYIPFENFPDANAMSLYENREGVIFIGTLNGKIYRFNERKYIDSIELPALSGIAAIQNDNNGNLWLGTLGKGIFNYKGGMFERLSRHNVSISDIVTSIFIDSENNVWFSTYNGVVVLRNANNSLESFRQEDGLKGKIVNNVYEDKYGHIWIATDKGITIIENGDIRSKKVIYYLDDVSVTCIYEDPSPPRQEEDVYWVSSSDIGFIQLTISNPGDHKKSFNNSIVQTTIFSIHQGMPSNRIFQFFEDKHGYFWLMSDSGIIRINKMELDNSILSKQNLIPYTIFNTSDGMKSIVLNNEKSRHSALITRNDELWFVTTKGISIINPNRIIIDKKPPQVVLEKIFINHKSITLTPNLPKKTFKGIKELGICFTAPTFHSPEKIKFKYRLKGFEKKWNFITAGRARVAHYKNLEPGQYEFNVSVCNADGVWNQTGESFSLTVVPFIHQRIWFKLVVIIAVILLLLIVYYLIKKIPTLKKKKLKTPLISDAYADECIKKLHYRMNIEKAYRDPHISLQSLADQLSITSHQLSQILNDRLEQKFTDFINSHRVAEARKRLQTPGQSEKKISAMAFEVGFNTMAAFYRAFKKFTGQTPTQYKRSIKKKSKVITK